MKSELLGPFLFFCFLAGSAEAAPKSTPLSTRVVPYSIHSNHNPNSQTVDGTEILKYKNLTGQPLSVFPFHLYLNAFRPNSTFTREAHRDYRDEEWKSSYLGAIDIKKFEVVGQGDLTA